MQQKPHQAILGIVIGFLILFVLFDIRWFLYISLGVGVLALVSTTMMRWIVYAWERLTAFSGYINSRILLSFIFYVILFPIAVLYRLTNKDSLNLKKGKKTYYKERNYTFEQGDLKNPW